MTNSVNLDDLPDPPADPIRRNQWGQYLIVPAAGANPVGYARVTTIAKALDSGGGLAPWKAAMTAQGLIMRRGLRAQWETLMAANNGDPWYANPTSKTECKRLVEECAAVGGANDRREMGTALHAIAALIDNGETPKNLTPETAADMKAYTDGLSQHGVTIVPGMVELTVVLDAYRVAGTFDRLVKIQGFTLPLVADLKTGGDLTYSWQSIAVQMAAYAHADDIYRQGGAQDGSEDTREPLPAVDQRYGLIMWLNADTAKLELFLVDLEAGWTAFEHSYWTRQWRGRKDVAFPLEDLLTDVAADKDDDPPELADVLEMSVLRNWLQEWIGVIGSDPDARADLVASWPADLPTLRQSNSHTLEELDVIEQLLTGIESRHRGLPFGPPRPTPNGQVIDLFGPSTTN